MSLMPFRTSNCPIVHMPAVAGSGFSINEATITSRVSGGLARASHTFGHDKGIRIPALPNTTKGEKAMITYTTYQHRPE